MTEGDTTDTTEHVIYECTNTEDPPWLPLFNQKYSNYKGLVNTLADAKEILRRLEVSTCTKYAVWNTNKKNFGLTEFSPFARAFRIFWGPDLVPYVMLNRKVLDCQHGRDRKVAWKQRQRAIKLITGEEGKTVKRRKKDPNLKSQSIIQNGSVVQISNWTKKYDCPAQVIFQEVLRFPDYKLKKNTKWTEIKTVRVLRKHLKEMERITCIRGFIVTVPENSHHQNHIIGLGVGIWRDIDSQILNWIQAMVAEGLTNVVKMRKNLRHLVKENFPNVDTSNTSFYPNCKTIAYHMHLARMRLLGTKDDPKDLEPQKGRFKKEKDEELCDYFFLPSRKPLRKALQPYNEKEILSEVTEVIQEFEDMQDNHDPMDSSPPIMPVVLSSTPAKPAHPIGQEFRDLLLQIQSYSFSVQHVPAMLNAYTEVELAFKNLKKACEEERKQEQERKIQQERKVQQERKMQQERRMAKVNNVGKTPVYRKRRVERIEVKCERVVDLKPPTIRQITFPSDRRKRDADMRNFSNGDYRGDDIIVPNEVAAVKLELTDDGSVLNITEYL